MRRLVFFLIVLALVFRGRMQCGEARMEPAETPADTARYVATVQEGLGASVAVLLDNSGSMAKPPQNQPDVSKQEIARSVLRQVLAQTDSFVAKQPGFPIKLGLYAFSRRVEKIIPIAPYSRASLDQGLNAIPEAQGATAIGDAMALAVKDLYDAGTIRKYLLVITDGENTTGEDPREVALEIERRSQGAVRIFLIAFDVSSSNFSFVREARGTLVEASNRVGLLAQLDTLYRGKILAEAVDAGETLPSSIPSPNDSVRRKPATAPHPSRP